MSKKFDVDFSLALHNRTGKYFIGRDLLQGAPEYLDKVYYWWFSLAQPASGLRAKVIGRLQYLHTHHHALGGPFRWLPKRQSKAPVLHLDPFTVLSTQLRSCDAVLCHDVGPLTHPELFDATVCRIYEHIYDVLAEVNCHLIFVSHASKQAYIKARPLARPISQHVIYPAIRDDVGNHTHSKPMKQITGPYLLTVGSVGQRKNQLACIKAFTDAKLAEQGISYVICGGPEPGFNEVLVVADATPGVILLDYVSDNELSWLYDNAAGFVLASLLEGFGIPVAEAISKGLVPIVTQDSVLYEVAGDGALLVDAEDQHGIAKAMIQLINMSDTERVTRLALLQQAIERFTPDKFIQDWKVALNTMLEINSTLNNKSAL